MNNPSKTQTPNKAPRPAQPATAAKPRPAGPAGGPSGKTGGGSGKKVDWIKTFKRLSRLAGFFIVPTFTLYSLFTGKKKRGLKHHFGQVPEVRKKTGQKLVWLHALSLGEVNAAVPVLKKIHEVRPNVLLVVSVTTDSGYDAAQRLMPFVHQIMFHPLDSWTFVNRALDRIQPDLFVLVDTGFWPGMLLALKERGIFSMIFNGRISEKSQARYKKFPRLVKPMLESFTLICMQTERGRTTMQQLGAPLPKIRIVGETKFDGVEPVPDSERQRIRDRLKIPPKNLVFVAGSTHEGEEEILMHAFQRIRRKYPLLTMVLAPRKIERSREIGEMLKKNKVNFVYRSRLGRKAKPSNSVVVLDTLGELAKVYSIADVTFVGSSLVAPGGGHNLLEPVSQGKCVIHGPYVENVQKIASELKHAGLAFIAPDAQGIASTVMRLLGKNTDRSKFISAAGGYIQSQRGTATEIAKYIVTLTSK